ncbi:ATP-binding cassette domain-containing protein [Verrucomicrobium spinosum]|uniref:ATP-binding cassette domain-containing protein n=1 Tax=Verrucomicrobium spinosum TaxID=2736 RepID=UPI00017452CD|nr:ATP-binding cassette domain-containing protein [Verrucomicrobium spinosum]
MSLVLANLRLPLADFALEVNVELAAPVTGLFGPSGAGKTSLLEVVAGLRRPSAGRVQLHGRVLDDAATRRHLAPEKRHVGYVPQDLALFPHLNARANLEFGHAPGGPISSLKVVEILELAPLLDRRVHHLSGGEKQRVALGRALLASPAILLMDEPLSSLDQRLRQRVLPYLQAVRREFSIPMIYVSHARDEIEMLCDEVLEIAGGQCTRRS